MISNRQQTLIRARGVIEGLKSDIQTVDETLTAAPLWRPGTALRKQCEEVLRMIDDLEARFDRKLVVTLIGPTGSGKSTLLNALAGVDDLSTTGNDRPTTRNLVVLCREAADATQLVDQIGGENIKIRARDSAAPLSHVLLIDTPDTDSTEQERHIPLVRRAIGLSDVLICMFNAENPKRRDYADFMAPYVQRFRGESLVCVLNKCDRLDETELEETILPELIRHIERAWDRPAEAVLCISARRHLNDPAWDERATPRHDFDQFDHLRDRVFGTFNRAEYVIDRRLENARALRDYIFEAVSEPLGRDREVLGEARTAMAGLEARAVRNALSALKGEDPRHQVGVNVLLYQRLAQRWMGPVGWVIALWARILIFGTGVAAMLRFGNPVSQVWGMVSSIRHFKESRAAIAEAGKGERVDRALRDYRLALLNDWPDLAAKLARGEFDRSVRRIESVMPEGEALGEELSGLWNDALDDALEGAANGLSGFFPQLIFNIPSLVVIGYAGWITGRAFFEGNYFSGDFFLHAFLTITLILFISFFIFQLIARMAAGTDRITTRAFETVKSLTDGVHQTQLNPLGEQLDAVLSLESIVGPVEPPDASLPSARLSPTPPRDAGP
jgi:energy-coupling factor transporter ATP-binding protein EcfA2